MFYSIRAQLIVIIVILMVPFIVMTYLFWEQAATSLRESIETSTVQTLNQYAEYVDNTASQTMNTANQILRSDITQNWIRLRKDNEYDDRDIQQNYLMRKYLESVISDNQAIFSINVFYDDWDMWNLKVDSYRNSEWYQTYEKGNSRWTLSHYDLRQNGTTMSSKRINSFVYPLSDLLNLEGDGVLKLNLLTSSFQEPLDKLTLGKTGKVFLMTPEDYLYSIKR